jgi:SAM-dependent methyltransferase
MKLFELATRAVPEPWSEGDNLPWNEPGFSRRMLKEHLSQEHDAASRRAPLIDAHVAFLHEQILAGKPSRILDLGCGPGLYLQRLAGKGHACRGIDFSPASIEYARSIAAKAGLAIEYELSDLRQAAFGEGYDLVLLLYGEFNVFRPEHARAILEKAHTALRPGGRLVLEPSPDDSIRSIGSRPAEWSAQGSGLFSDRPHLVLEEAFWDEARRAATSRWYIVDAASAEVTLYASTYQAYSAADLRDLLACCGFGEPCFYPNLAGSGERSPDFVALSAIKGSPAPSRSG